MHVQVTTLTLREILHPTELKVPKFYVKFVGILRYLVPERTKFYARKYDNFTRMVKLP